MKNNSRLLHGRRGGVMAIALVCIGALTIGYTSWVGLLSQRSRAGEIEDHAARRRIASWNTRSAIREYALTRAVTSSIDDDGLSFDPLAGWSVTNAASWSGFPMESNTRLAGLNAFSFTWDYPYSKVFDTESGTFALDFVRAGNGRLDADYTASASYLKTYIRSRCPVLGGDLLVVHRSSLTPPVDPVIAGNLTVRGRVLHFVPELADTAYTARSYRFIAPPAAGTMGLRPLDLSGTALLPSNLSWTPVTFGNVAGVPDFSGQLNVIDDAGNGGNSLRHKLAGSPATIPLSGTDAMSDPRGFESDGNGLLTLTPAVNPLSTADIPSIIVDSEVEEIIIEGQDDANFDNYARYRPSMALCYVQSAASARQLQRIRLRGQNSRRIVLAIKQDGPNPGSPVTVIVEDNHSVSNWHMVILAENTPLIFTADAAVSTINLVGGLQSNSPITGPAGSQILNLELESDTRGLIRMTPRAAWVEVVMPDKIPGTSSDNTW
jgi:hypothetical protein